MGCPSPINNLEKRAYETPVREVLQGSGGNNTAELWIPFSPSLPDGFQSFAEVEMCVCAHACVPAHVLGNEEWPLEGEKRVSGTFPIGEDRFVVKIQNMNF